MIISFCRITRQVKSFRRFFSSYQVLGIESSCDDTSAAVVNDKKQILGEGHFSQSKIHVETGGVLCHVAQYLHKHNLKDVVETCMNQSNLNYEDLTAIAVTVKPGLILSLDAGVEYAKNLCKLHNKPLIPIHHMEAHALTARLVQDIQFPFLCLLISGGHCLLSVVESIDKFYTLGKHTDTSPGQAMDKVARRAKLNTLKEYRGLAGGAAIEAAAASGDPTAYKLTDDFQRKLKNCNFSFSGISSKAITIMKEQEKIQGTEPGEVISDINDLCASFQWEVTKRLCMKVEYAFMYLKYKNWLNENCQSLVVSGGVASNQFIRATLKFLCDQYGYELIVPPPKLCTDNGVMIAWNGIEKLKTNTPLISPDELDSVSPLAKCPLGEDVSDDINGFLRCFTQKTLKFNELLTRTRNIKEKRCQQ